MRRLMINTLMATGLVVGMGGALQAGGHGGSGGHGGQSSGRGGHATGKGSFAGHAGHGSGHGNQSGHAVGKGGHVGKNSQFKSKTSRSKGPKNSKWAKAPRRLTGVQPRWRRYWNSTYCLYMYADPDYDCTYYWDDQEGCYCMLAEDDD